MLQQSSQTKDHFFNSCKFCATKIFTSFYPTKIAEKLMQIQLKKILPDVITLQVFQIPPGKPACNIWFVQDNVNAW